MSINDSIASLMQSSNLIALGCRETDYASKAINPHPISESPHNTIKNNILNNSLDGCTEQAV